MVLLNVELVVVERTELKVVAPVKLGVALLDVELVVVKSTGLYVVTIAVLEVVPVVVLLDEVVLDEELKLLLVVKSTAS